MAVDPEARDDALKALSELRTYIEVQEARRIGFENTQDLVNLTLEKKLDELKSWFKWAGSFLFTSLISLLVWSLTQQFQANKTKETAIEAAGEARQSTKERRQLQREVNQLQEADPPNSDERSP